MGLSNLQAIGRLQPQPPDPANVVKRLVLTRRWLRADHPEWGWHESLPGVLLSAR